MSAVKDKMPKLKPFKIDPDLTAYDLVDKEDYLIPVNYGHGIRWTSKDGEQCMSVLRYYRFQDGKRVATRNWSTYTGGPCFTAMHWYARIDVFGCDVKFLSNGSFCSMGGYGPEFDKVHEYFRAFSIKAERVLTKVEHDMNDELIGKIGEKTYRFNSEEEAKAAALEVFKKRFAPGWILIDGDDCNIVLAET